LLGPLVACAGGLAVPITAAKQRVVLAALLLNAGRVVGVDELAEAVWGVAVPTSARATLQNYVKRLRCALGDAGRRCISTQPDGYLLSFGSGELDVGRFESLQESGRRAARQREWKQAAAQLWAALALWRGELLADVPSDRLLMQHGPRLAELRAQALEARIEADLQLGGHAAVISELRQLTGAYPLREHPHELLMLALYRDGRQAEALAAYQEARQALIGELGLEPGPGLRALQQHILSADPGLGARAAPQPGAGAAGSPGGARTTGPSSGHDGLAALVRAEPNRMMRDGGDPACRQAVSGHFVVPRQLPAGLARFAGRQAELAVLLEMADAAGSMAGAGGETAAVTAGGVTIAAISGTAGVGKTALALHFAHRVADRFPDGQLYVNLRGFDPSSAPLGTCEAIRAFLDALQVHPDQLPAGLDAEAGLYRSLLVGRRMLVVLDNALDATQVRPLLPGDGGCLVVVTSRRQLTALAATDGARQVILDVLASAEAHDLLTGRLGAGRLAAEPAAAEELAVLCARLPLALSIVAARASARPGLPLAALAAVLRDARGRLDVLDGGEAAADARAVFSWSCKQLSPSGARMFRLLGLHPGPDISLSAAASLAGMPRATAGTALRELARANMAAEHMPGRFKFHDLLRVYAADRADWYDSAPEQRAAVHRVLDHYLHTALAASQRFSPFRSSLRLAAPQPGVLPAEMADKDQAMAWFDAEAPVLLTLIDYASTNGFDTHAWQIPWTLGPFFNRRGRWRSYAASQQIALAAAQRLDDTLALAHTHHLLGHAQLQMNDYEAAEPNFRQALDLFRELRDRANEAVVLNGLGIMLEKQERFPEALAVLLDALRMLKAAGHWWTQATLENGVGWLYAHLGQYDDALNHCQRSLSLHRESGHRGGAADALDSLGYVYLHLGDLAQAQAHYRQAIDAYREIAAPFGEGNSLAGLGDVLLRGGDPDTARGLYLQAAAILDALPHPLADVVRGKLDDLDQGPDPDRLAGQDDPDRGPLPGAATTGRSV
jgi:DNA-binding SARP family transcriptional activator/Tfp pilus assembly protein PilF